jgi:Tfp pilus assembly protein PilV
MELLMTLAITTIGLIGLLSLHLSIARGNDGASRTAEAQQVGTLTIEQLRAQRITDMMQTLTGSSTSVPPVSVAMPTMTGRNGSTYARTVSVTALNSASTSLWKLRVVVTWQEDGAVAGTSGGIYDHSMAVEVIRTVEEAL